MSITTFQKVTLVSCIVLCISLFLPKIMFFGMKKEMMQKTAGPGYYPTGLPRKQPAEGLEPWVSETQYPDVLSPEAITKAQAKGTMWGNKKSNHFGQIVPIYGVGILFYILHIFFKLTRQDKKAKPAIRCPIPNSESLSQHISEEELAKLEARLSHAEMLMNRVMSPSSSNTDSVKSQHSSRKKRETSLLRRLRRFGRSLQEDQREGVTPEMEAEEVPYALDWEGYPEETFPQYDEPCGRKYDTIIVEAPPPDQRSAEELAEQMEKEDEEMERELGVIEEGDEDIEEMEEKTEDEEEEEEEEEEEGEETEDDEMFKYKEPEEEEEEEEEVGEETPCLPQPESVVERSSQARGGLARFLGLTSGDPPECRRRRITFSEHKDIFLYPREGTIDEEDEEEEEEEEEEEDGEEEDDDDGDDDNEEEEEVARKRQVPSGMREGVMEVDPLMEAESLKFSTEASSEDESERMEQEEEGDNGDKKDDDEEEESDDDYDDDEEEDEDDDQEVGLEEFLSTYRPAMNTRLSQARVDLPPTASQLRMRNKGKDKEV